MKDVIATCGPRAARVADAEVQNDVPETRRFPPSDGNRQLSCFAQSSQIMEAD